LGRASCLRGRAGWSCWGGGNCSRVLLAPRSCCTRRSTACAVPLCSLCLIWPSDRQVLHLLVLLQRWSVHPRRAWRWDHRACRTRHVVGGGSAAERLTARYNYNRYQVHRGAGAISIIWHPQEPVRRFANTSRRRLLCATVSQDAAGRGRGRARPAFGQGRGFPPPAARCNASRRETRACRHYPRQMMATWHATCQCTHVNVNVLTQAQHSTDVLS
jgi:hypothetical protein